MKRVLTTVVFLALVSPTEFVQAADNPNLTGTWELSIEVYGDTHIYPLKLKLDGNKLTGAVVDDIPSEDGTYEEYPLRGGKCKDGAVSFTVIAVRHGAQMPVVVVGKLSGDTMKGKADAELDGQHVSLPWDAKRIVVGNPAGTWKVSIEVAGEKRQFTLKLKQNGGKWSGSITGKDGKEKAVQGATFQDGCVSFTVVHDENGIKIPVKVTGAPGKATMSGTADFVLDGKEQSISWEAKRVKN